MTGAVRIGGATETTEGGGAAGSSDRGMAWVRGGAGRGLGEANRGSSSLSFWALMD